MKRSQFLGMMAAAALSPALAACGGKSANVGSSSPSKGVSVSGEITPREISWLLSRPANGPVITVMQQIAKEYAAKHPGFSLKLVTTPDRPSYLQKFQTLAAANQLPELFDTDATPYAQKLAKQGRMVDVKALLDDFGMTSQFRPAALDYQRFDDGSLYMIPFEFGIEVFWYNKALFSKAGVTVPQSLADFPELCRKLRASGVTPIALDGKDGWPLERWIAYMPFRAQGKDYVNQLKQAKATFSDQTGKQSAQWISDLAKAKAFQDGFSSVGYTDAQNLFTSGKAAIYNMGTWELASLATAALPKAMQDNIAFFTLPTMAGAKTAANEYTAPSGIGAAVNASTFDALVKDFLKFALSRYPELYAKGGLPGPTSLAPVVPTNALPIYKEALTTADKVGSTALMPWDTQLDPTTNTLLQQELVLLAQGNIGVDEFASTMDKALAANAKKYFA